MFVKRIIITCCLYCAALPLVQGEKGYYRYPAIHGETLVFTAEGDLWKITLGDESAIRITTHPEPELHAAISPDGKQIAFSASYDGPQEVYLVAIGGGRPQRITYDGESARVTGWTPDGRIAYATRHYSTLPNTQLVLIDPETLVSQRLELQQASQVAWLPNQIGVVFTRLSKQGSSTKRYHGGSVESLWKYLDGEPEAVDLIDEFTGTCRSPMVSGQRIFFNSDRDGTMNIWSMDFSGGDWKQHTHHQGFDVLRPALHDGRIVYQLGADLMLLDLQLGSSRRISIRLASDFQQAANKWIRQPVSFLDSYSLSEDGTQLALTSRGQIVVLPVDQGRSTLITRAVGVRYRSSFFQPEQDSIISLSDESGEYEFWRLPVQGIGERQQLTKNGDVFRYRPTPSPDGKHFAFSDKNHHLWVVDVDNQKRRRIGISNTGNFYDLAWSADSRWLAYVQPAENLTDQIWIWDSGTRESTTVTTDRADSYSPAWSPDGKFLYFLSDRHLRSSVRSPWGPRQPEPYFDRTTKIYQLALQQATQSPFAEPTELTMKPTEKGAVEKETNTGSEELPAIELQDIQRRISVVPVEPGNYSDLEATDGYLYWTSTVRDRSTTDHLRAIKRKHDADPVTVMSDINSYRMTHNGKYLATRRQDEFYVFPVNGKGPDSLSDARVSLAGWEFEIDQVEEWRQMFVDAWRLERDYFYDKNLHGVDWKEVLARHLPLVDRVTDRAELNDLLEQMVGELEALHIYVRGGEHRDADPGASPASLGAILTRSDEQQGYLVEHVYQTDPDYPDRIAPLARPEVAVAAGAIIRQVNGVDVLSVPHINRLLNNQSGKQIRLQVQDAQQKPLRDVVVRGVSMAQEADMRYDQWEYTRRQVVEDSGNQRIGYVHLRAMGQANIAEWAREFYPVHDRQALIIDVRNNRGGNIDSWILEKLLRQAWFYWKPRVGRPYWNMQYAFRGHMVVLCNERTASDGEAFAEGFRRLGLGKVIGTRTWGGEIWLSINNRLVDRGYASAAQTGVYGPEGKWLIEGHGVDPDIVVDNLPHATFSGQDAQLEFAIKYLLEEIKKDPRAVPTPPAYPVRPGARKIQPVK
ncbi:MAG: S41 family peptidase [Planctomycetota bacterium]|nr:S41 family peptidase [Planctomycetota bacterium]